MERHYQHTSPFPPEFRTTHNFYTKEVFVMPLHPAFSWEQGGGPEVLEACKMALGEKSSWTGYFESLM